MPFEKGNTLGRKAAKSREESKQRLWDFIASGGAAKYHKKLEELSNGAELSKPEQEFMDRVERLFPFVKAKLSSVDQNMNLKGDIIINSVSYKKD